MKTVTILLSTYNGEKYIAEQLDSLLAQKGVSIRIQVRDDGSTDRTPEILQQYQSRHPESISVGQGLHKGFSGSFLALALQAEDADYYAFCDQDDVWLPDKLQTAVSRIDNSSGIPELYFSNAMLADSSCRPIRPLHDHFSLPPVLSMRLTDNPAPGCTMVFNKKARELFVLADENKIIYYDYWMYLLCSYMGKVVYDSSCRVLYRQHAENTFGHLRRKKIWAARLHKLTHRLHLHEFAAAELLRLPDLQNPSSGLKLSDNPDISPAELEKLKLMAEYRKDFSSRMRLLFHKEFKTAVKGQTFFFKLQVLLGCA